jgi:hypothetical protein
VNKTVPHEIQKILGVAFTNVLETLKIAGSRTEFLDFDF